jgi:putative ABC transport system permease protein
MKTALFLGLRLAVGKGGQRARTVVATVASAIGAVVVLLVWGVAVSTLGTTTQFRYNPGAITLLMSGAIGMVALPVAVLIATIARLSAGIRDRRLANLRLLGLTAGQTRMVAAVDVGVASIVGSMLGAIAAAVLASAGTKLMQSEAKWADASLAPPAFAWAMVTLAIPAVAVVSAVLPHRLASSEGALAHVRQRAAGPVRLIRAGPLLLGFLLCWSTRSPLLDGSTTLDDWEIAAAIAGIALLGIGMLLVIPVFMSLIATVVLKLGRGPLATLVGRRLQTQPASATRVIAALMMGLFIVVGARGVLAAFLATPQYVAAADFVERAQTAEVTSSLRDLKRTVGDLGSIEGVHEVVSFPILNGEPLGASPDGSNAVTVIAATCADLTQAGSKLLDCSADGPTLVGDPWLGIPDAETVRLRSASGYEPHGPAVGVDLRHATVIDPVTFEHGVGALSGIPVVIVPPDTPGVGELLPSTDRLVVAHAGPGRYLYDRVAEEGYLYNSSVDLVNYDFVQGMLVVVWTLAAVIIAIGLATFAIAGIDRAIGRRRELTALRLIGTPPRLLRTAQWLEAALPTVLGSAVAIVAGAYAGATYLQRDDSLNLSVASTVSLAVTAGITSLLVAWITTIGTAAQLDPEHIRSE